jgi:hypothetical protein
MRGSPAFQRGPALRLLQVRNDVSVRSVPGQRGGGADGGYRKECEDDCCLSPHHTFLVLRLRWWCEWRRNGAPVNEGEEPRKGGKRCSKPFVML